MKKRLLTLAMTAVIVLGAAACSSKKEEAPATDSTQKEETKTPEGMTGAISVISREEGSGTRGAFVELMEVVDGDKNDITTVNAEITNSTSVMLTTVAGNKQAIGYVSLGSLSDEVKAVKVDGVEASTDDIKNGSYKVSRPFLLAYKDGQLSELAQDYLKYILSSDGQKLISDNGYISIAENAEAYKASGLSGKLVLAGSTSVSPVMEKLADAYKALNPNVTVEIQQTGSGAGITSAIDGVCDFGMSSRELKESEAAELKSVEMALDGIAVVVNKENPIENITSEQIKSIYLGETTDWSAIQ
ncbi:MAG: substrate-binding domain-containing protein [Candidatus Metalachnospira sp.]|nr:substrate-binding domain-containing protein [Candidatus Metalachnospira sp.]